MEKIIFQGLNPEATITDLLSAPEDEFSAILSKIKAEYKHLNNVPSKKKAVKPYNFVLQKLRQLSKHYKKHLAQFGREHYLDLDELFNIVWEQNKESLNEMAYTKERFMLDFATQTATIMASAVYQKSYCYNEDYLLHFKGEYGGEVPESASMASYLVFRGIVYRTKFPDATKIPINYPKKAMTEGIDDLHDEFEEIVLHFRTFSQLDEYIGKCALVTKMYTQDQNHNMTKSDVNQLFTLTDEEMGLRAQPADEDEKTSEDEGSE